MDSHSVFKYFHSVGPSQYRKDDPDELEMMEDEFQLDPIETAKVSLKTPDDALSYWNHRLEMVRTITSFIV